MSSQASKRSRSHRKQGLSHPSHVSARDWRGYFKRNEEKIMVAVAKADQRRDLSTRASIDRERFPARNQREESCQK